MAVVAADRAGIGAHRDGAHAKPREGAQVGDEHLVIGMDRVFAGQIEGISILHQEFARAHGAEARADFVAELQLDMVEVERQVLVGLDVGPEDVGDHFLVGRAVEHRTLLAILDAQHFLAVSLVTTAFLPEFGRLERRHQQLNGACTVLLFADDGVDLVQHLLAERQPGIDALALLADHARAQHQAVGDDFRFLGIFLQDGHKIAGQAHGNFRLLTGLPHLAGIGRFEDHLRGLLPVPRRQGNPAPIEKPVDDRSKNPPGLAENVIFVKAGVRQMRQRQFFPHLSQKYKKRG
ncbi:hypothetical protein D3C73_1087460 [compost metagenome]